MRLPRPLSRRRPIRALYVCPSPDTPGLTPAERLALTIRRDATVTGRCARGATMRVDGKGAVVHAVMEHEEDCPAADGPHLRRLAERLGDRLRSDFVVVELEAPT
jgi:hypothetical protein